jgi:hypothetical protein
MSEPKLVTLENVAGGAAEELFQSSLAQVLENIQDPNTDHKARRRITITVDVQVLDEERRSASFGVKCSTKLAGVKTVATTVILGKHLGRFAAAEPNQQGDMFTAAAAKPAVVEGGKAAGNGA